jgi:WD40 repeat protein
MTNHNDYHAQDWISASKADGLPELTDEQRALARELLGLAQDIHLAPNFIDSLERQLAEQAHVPREEKRGLPERIAGFLAGMRSFWSLGYGLAALALIAILIAFSLEFLPRSAVAPSALKNTPTTILKATSTLEKPATPIPLVENKGFLEPLDIKECRDLQSALAGELGLPVELDPDAAYIDPAVLRLDRNGRGCELRASGTGVEFGSISLALERLSPLIEAAGFETFGLSKESYSCDCGEETSYFPDAWYGKEIFFNRSDRKAQLSVSWRPQDAKDCVLGQPEAACQISPEQQHFVLRVSLAVDPLTPAVQNLLDSFMGSWKAYDPKAFSAFSSRLQSDLTGLSAISSILGVQDPYGVLFGFTILDFSSNQLLVRLELSRRDPLLHTVEFLSERDLSLTRENSEWRIDQIAPAGSLSLSQAGFPHQLPTETPAQSSDSIRSSTRLLAGLVYRAFLGDASLYQINAAGQSVVLSNHVNVNISALSPDGRWGLVNSLGDYWIIDLAQDNLLKLTLTPDRQESGAVWWPARPGLILFDSITARSERDLAVGMGYLSVIHSDGSGYRVLDGEHPAITPPAPSPDGQWIAYGSGETAWLYHWDQGTQSFAPRDYGLESLKGQRISGPQWSPDGKKLAWSWESMLNVGPRQGVVVFDLESKKAQLLHLFEPGGASSGLEFRWSPDGKWLAVLAQSKDESQAGTWVVSTDGQKYTELRLTGMDYGPAVWSPDGRWLVLTPLGEKNQSENGLWLLDSASWQRSFVEMPQEGPYDILEWRRP